MSEQADWAEYWQQEGAAGEVFVTADGKKHSALSEFWQSILCRIEANDKVVDIASGAGSVFSNLTQTENFELHATDISSQALEILKQRIPKVQTHVESAASSHLQKAYFNWVFSQFGIEYAGVEAFRQAARLLAKNAELHMLCHISGGYISSVNQPNYQGAQLINSSRFIECAKTLTRAAFDQDQAALELAGGEFSKVEPQLAEYVKLHEQGLHTHLYQGFKQLFQQRNAYDCQDIVSWLDAMQQEVNKTLERICEINKAMLNEEDMARIQSILLEEGLSRVEYQPLVLPGHNSAVAWYLTAVRPN